MVQCQICNENFSAERNLNLHLLKQHPDSIQTFGCKFCSKKFLTTKGLTLHLWKYHSEEYQKEKDEEALTKNPFKCTFCIKSFPKKNSLSIHTKKFHSEEYQLSQNLIYPIECKLCTKRFATEQSLTLHLRQSHLNEYPKIKEEKKIKKHKDAPFKCSQCGRGFDTYNGLAKHAIRFHKISSIQLLLNTFYNGIMPLCKCGCGQEVIHPKNIFINGHSSRVHPGTITPKMIENSLKSRKEKWASGELIPYQKGKTYNEIFGKEKADRIKEKISTKEGRSERISKALKGREKSPEHIAKITEDRKKYWGDPIHREEQRYRRVRWMTENQRIHNTGLEKLFKKILENSNIDYIFQFALSGFNYDFKIQCQNILIEVDGDFYHCNPIKFENPIYDVQKNTIAHDKIKNSLAQTSGYKLLRFWESDIKTHPEQIIEILKKELELTPTTNSTLIPSLNSLPL